MTADRKRRRATGLGIVALLVLASAGCGGSSHAPAARRGLGPALATAPVACTHHLVFARNGSSARRMVALSFDDTPSKYTEEIVRTLLRYHAAATFFVIGNRIPGNAPLLREMLEHGMELGNHSYSHPRDMATEAQRASQQIERANAAIEQATGLRPCLFRPPYGVLTPDLVQRARVLGLTTAKWTVDPGDWLHPGVGAIRERALAAAGPGAIVILHDNTETHGQTLAALPGIITGLQARGLQLVTISQLLGDRFLAAHAAQTSG
jgi:peptidoglycan/xylan/chitin deacetylase (PgdA/CDA1 family)